MTFVIVLLTLAVSPRGASVIILFCGVVSEIVTTGAGLETRTQNSLAVVLSYLSVTERENLYFPGIVGSV